jgi:endonuclease-3 related protein
MGEVSSSYSMWQGGREAAAWVYERLLACYGPQGWWPGDTPLEIVVGAILTQSTSWRNVERALARLRAALALDVSLLLTIDENELAWLIQPAGFFRVKARRLRALFDHIASEHNGNLSGFLSQPSFTLRQELLGITGIGEETADSILLYAAARPFFVIDAYTRRIWRRLGLRQMSDGYAAWQDWFHDRLPREGALFNEYHALLVRHAKETCRPQPRCEACCLKEQCAFAYALTGAPRVPLPTADSDRPDRPAV